MQGIIEAMTLDRASVQRARAAATQDWSHALGGANACVLAKNGQSHPAGKFHEGRVAALGELLRQIHADAAPTEIADAADSLRSQWQRRATSAANQDWASYWAGGLAELETVKESA